MKNISVLFFLIVLLCITMIFFFLNKQMDVTNNQFQPDVSDTKKNFIKRNKELNIKLTNSKFKNITYEDIAENQNFLSDLVLTSPTLIYRYSELNCNTCYETEITLLQEYFPDENLNIAIFCSYQTREYFLRFKRMNQIIFPVYRIPQDAFGWKLEDYGAPYYFVLHPDLTVSDIYIPDKAFPDLSKKYLAGVKRFLSDGVAEETESDMVEEISSSKEQPEIQVNAKHDFGELDSNDKVHTFFEFENISPVPFVIMNVTTSCGCTVSEWDRKPARKGEKLKVKVGFSSESTGLFSKRITVFSNAKGSPHTLTITGNVK